MLSVTNKPSMLSVIMVNVVMLSVVMLNVVAPQILPLEPGEKKMTKRCCVLKQASLFLQQSQDE
jgi:hypothetical protein